jgi:hypothetical protein
MSWKWKEVEGVVRENYQCSSVSSARSSIHLAILTDRNENKQHSHPWGGAEVACPL